MLNVRLFVVAGAVIAAAHVAGSAAARRAGLTRVAGADIAMAGLGWFIVAARLTWIALHPGAMSYPFDVIRITQGLDTAGGVVGAAVGVIVGARRRGVDWRMLAGPAVTAAMAAAAAWHATCFVHQRCGGIVAAPPFGVPLGGSDTQVPVSVLLALGAAVLGWISWRDLRAHQLRVRRPVACAATLVAALALSGAVQLRLDPWPSIADAALGVIALLLGAVGVLACRSGTTWCDPVAESHDPEQLAATRFGR